MPLRELTRDDLPDVLALAAHEDAVSARMRGEALLAVSSDLARIVWANAQAAHFLGLSPGPQEDGSQDLARRIAGALSDGSAGEFPIGNGSSLAFTLHAVTLDETGRRCSFVRFQRVSDAPMAERSSVCAEIAGDPIAIWHADRSWFGNGFGDAGEVYLEDLHELKDGAGDIDLAFLPNGKAIGLAKLSRRMIAVWHVSGGPFASLDLRSAGDRDESAMPANGSEDAPEEGARPSLETHGDEIASLKTVGGSLLSAASAALGSAMLGRIGAHRPPNISEGEMPSPAREAEPAAREPSGDQSRQGEGDGEATGNRFGTSDMMEHLATGIGLGAARAFADKERERALAESEEQAASAPVRELAEEAPLNDDAGAAASAIDGNFTPDFSKGPVRFAWRLDAEGRFQSLSPEFAATVGPRAADVGDLSLVDILDALKIDPEEQIVDLIARRDTWSNRTVLWPAEGSARQVPVDLAALPVYARDRSFDGFRGFGVARPVDAEDDPSALGLTLAAGETLRAIVSRRVAEAADAPVDFGREFGEAPDPDGPDDAGHNDEPSAGTDERIVHLPRRRQRGEAPLSDEEAAAFRTIGATLSDGKAPSALDEAVLNARRRIEQYTSSTDERRGANEHATDDEDGERGRSDGRILADLAVFYGRLPIPILVQSGDATLFTNEEFSDLTGYRDARAVAAAGGLDNLFAEHEPGESVRLKRANGRTIDVRARMQRVAIRGRSILVISFFAAPRLTLTDLSESPDAAPASRSAPAPVRAGEPLSAEDHLAEVLADFDAEGEAVLILDPDGRIEAFNRCAESVFASADILSEGDEDRPGLTGQAFTEFFEGESWEAARNLVDRTSLSRTGEPEAAELSLSVDGGNLVHLLANGEPLETGGWCIVMRGAGMEPDEASLHARDRRESDAARIRAETQSLRKTRFMAEVSHEIRTPMTAILGFADAFETEAFGPIGNSRYLDYIADIKRSGQLVLDLVNDLLELARAEAGALDLHPDAVPLNQVAGEVLSMMQPVAGSARIVLRSNLPASVPPVIADERTIRQILTNLVRNAIAGTPAGGQVIVSSQFREDGGVILRCRDNGIGMSEAELEIALQPYGRLRSDDGRPGVGTGLGLPLSRAMAEANGAVLTIESAPQNGTLAELVFPRGRVLAD